MRKKRRPALCVGSLVHAACALDDAVELARGLRRALGQTNSRRGDSR